MQLVGLPAGPLAVRLFDAQGQLVRTVTTTEVPLTGLAPASTYCKPLPPATLPAPYA